MRRFRATLLALVAFAASLGLAALTDRPAPVDPTPAALFRFDEDALARVEIVRPDGTVTLAHEDGAWRAVGQPWRPDRGMIRRIAHQLHALDARGLVTDAADPSRYGLGERAVRVTLTLSDGRTVAFEAGDPNPTGVSHYLRPLPGDAVYVVRKAAVDFFSYPLDAFRERRFAAFDASRAVRLDATFDGETWRLVRGDGDAWRMTAPLAQDVERDEIRGMLGRIASLRARDFVADTPGDLAAYGLAPPRHVLAVGLDTGEAVTVQVGDPVPGGDGLRYVRRVEDDAVYTVADGFLGAFGGEPARIRRHTLLDVGEADVDALTVRRGTEEVRITRSPDAWRWPDGAPIAGSTPRRLARVAGSLRAVAFVDEEPEPWATVTLEVDGDTRQITVGDEVVRDGARLRRARVGEERALVDADLADAVRDLLRERARSR